MATRTPLPPLVAALTFEIGQSGSAVQLLPAGEFRAVDGRPKECAAWRLDARLAAAVIDKVATRTNPMVFDYEHQTLFAATRGHPAPAAGWFKTLEWREGQGLFAIDVEWTERARTMIAAREYRYVSAVFLYDQQGRVTEILHAALTNNPALDGMDEVQVAALSRLADFSSLSTHQENTVTLLEKLIAALGLAAGATEEQALAACSSLKTQSADAESRIAALAANQADPAKFVSVDVMRELQNQVAALSAQVNAGQVDDLVGVALSDGRLLPAQEPWARELGKTNLAALTQYLETAPKVAALTTTQTGGKAPEAGKPAPVEAEFRAVCSMFGNDPAEVQKTLNQEQQQ